jgi:RNA polymerase sigma factor (sigma-70 family)
VTIIRSFAATPDQEIINCLHKGGTEKIKAEDQLFSRYSYFIGEAVHKYALLREEAFDAYADTILAGLEKIINGSYQGRSSLKTWLYQIFHNKCVDLIRKKSTNKSNVYRTSAIDDHQFQVSDTVKSIIQKLVDKTDFDLLKERLSQLGNDCRQMLQQWAEGFNDKEIAAMMNYKTADVAKTSRLRCLERLKKMYKNAEHI